MPKKRLRIAGIVLGIVAVIVIAGVAAIVMLLSRYVTIEEADAQTATRAFASAREQLHDPTPLIEYRDVAVVHRDDSTPRHTLNTIKVLVYDADDGVLKRAAIPARLVEMATFGGRIRLMDLETFGDGRDRITLEDLERHGPGLVLDVSASSVPQIALANFILRRQSLGGRVLVWTE